MCLTVFDNSKGRGYIIEVYSAVARVFSHLSKPFVALWERTDIAITAVCNTVTFDELFFFVQWLNYFRFGLFALTKEGVWANGNRSVHLWICCRASLRIPFGGEGRRNRFWYQPILLNLCAWSSSPHLTASALPPPHVHSYNPHLRFFVFVCGDRLAVRRNDNLLLTLSYNQPRPVVIGIAGGQSENLEEEGGVISAYNWPGGRGGGLGLGGQIVTPPPSSSWCLRAVPACLPAWQLVWVLVALMAGSAVWKHSRAAFKVAQVSNYIKRLLSDMDKWVVCPSLHCV